MKGEKDVTIKAQDLDLLLQLAVVGSRVQQRKEDQKVLFEDVDRLRGVDAPKPQNDRRLSDSNPATYLALDPHGEFGDGA